MDFLKKMKKGILRDILFALAAPAFILHEISHLICIAIFSPFLSMFKIVTFKFNMKEMRLTMHYVTRGESGGIREIVPLIVSTAPFFMYLACILLSVFSKSWMGVFFYIYTVCYCHYFMLSQMDMETIANSIDRIKERRATKKEQNLAVRETKKLIS